LRKKTGPDQKKRTIGDQLDSHRSKLIKSMHKNWEKNSNREKMRLRGIRGGYENGQAPRPGVGTGIERSGTTPGNSRTLASGNVGS